MIKNIKNKFSQAKLYKTNIKVVLLISLLTSIKFNLKSYEYPLFYRAPSFWGESRFERDMLTSAAFQIRYAHSYTSRNSCGYKTSLLDIYGPYNMQKLISGVPNIDPSNSLDQILINLASLPQYSSFANLRFFGKLRVFEANFNFVQNLYKGFFIAAALPFKEVSIKNIKYCDLSPEEILPTIPNKNTTQWVEFLNNFGPIMQRLGVDVSSSHNAGVGDFAMLAGWAMNKEDTEILDFIDTDIQIGVQLPTAPKRSLQNPFVLPLGYPSVGVPLIWDFALGAYEWITLGARVDALFFTKYNTNLKIKTDKLQSGMIKLVTDTVRVCPGSIWNMGLYFKADRIIRGFSALLGYSFTKRDKDIVLSCSNIFSNEIINSDDALKSWKMHVIHLLFEYDFCNHNNKYAPRFGLSYDHIVAGKRIMLANPFSAYVAVDIAWYF